MTLMTTNDDENENPFAGADILGPEEPAAPEAELDPLGDPISPPPPAAAPSGAPWNTGRPAGKVPRIFVDQQTGGIVEIAKKDQTFLRHYPEMGKAGAVEYSKISGGRANHLLKLPAIQQYLRNVFHNAGINDTLIAEKIREGLEAVTQKDHVMKVVEVDGNGITRESQKLVAGPARVDYDQRGKYIDRAMALQGLGKPDAAAMGGLGGSPLPTLGALAQLSAEDLSLLLDALKRQKAREQAEEAIVEPVEPVPPPAAEQAGADGL